MPQNLFKIIQKKVGNFSKIQIFLLILSIGIITPLIAVIPRIIIDYNVNINDIVDLFFLSMIWGLSFYNIIPYIILGIIATILKDRYKSGILYSTIGTLSFILLFYILTFLSESSTSGIAIIFLPFYCILVYLVCFIIGHIIGKENEKKIESKLNFKNVSFTHNINDNQKEVGI